MLDNLRDRWRNRKDYYEFAKTRCEIVMSRPGWELELCQRLATLLERNYRCEPQCLYDKEEKELLMLILGLT